MPAVIGHCWGRMMTIAVLRKGEPMNDLISRQAAEMAAEDMPDNEDIPFC